MLAIVKSILLAPLYTVLAAALLLQGRSGLSKFAALTVKGHPYHQYHDALPELFEKLNVSPCPLALPSSLTVLQTFLLEAFGDPAEMKIDLLHILLLANLLALITLSASYEGKTQRK